MNSQTNLQKSQWNVTKREVKKIVSSFSTPESPEFIHIHIDDLIEVINTLMLKNTINSTNLKARNIKIKTTEISTDINPSRLEKNIPIKVLEQLAYIKAVTECPRCEGILHLYVLCGGSIWNNRTGDFNSIHLIPSDKVNEYLKKGVINE